MPTTIRSVLIEIPAKVPPTLPFSLSGTSTSPSTNFRLSPEGAVATFSVSITRWKLFTALVFATLSETRSAAELPGTAAAAAGEEAHEHEPHETPVRGPAPNGRAARSRPRSA